MPQDVDCSNLIKMYCTVHTTAQYLQCTVEFIRDLKTIPINEDTRLASFNITDMCKQHSCYRFNPIIKKTKKNAVKQNI